LIADFCRTVFDAGPGRIPPPGSTVTYLDDRLDQFATHIRGACNSRVTLLARRTMRSAFPEHWPERPGLQFNGKNRSLARLSPA